MVSKDDIVSIGVNLPGRLNPHTGYSYSYFNFSSISISDYLIAEKMGSLSSSIMIPEPRPMASI